MSDDDLFVACNPLVRLLLSYSNPNPSSIIIQSVEYIIAAIHCEIVVQWHDAILSLSLFVPDDRPRPVSVHILPLVRSVS